MHRGHHFSTRRSQRQDIKQGAGRGWASLERIKPRVGLSHSVCRRPPGLREQRAHKWAPDGRLADVIRLPIPQRSECQPNLCDYSCSWCASPPRTIVSSNIDVRSASQHPRGPWDLCSAGWREVWIMPPTRKPRRLSSQITTAQPWRRSYW